MKRKTIKDLEKEISTIRRGLFAVRLVTSDRDNGPCYCALPDVYRTDETKEGNHTKACRNARALTISIWKAPEEK